VGLNLGKNVSEQGKAAFALEALKEGGEENFRVVSIGEILKEVAPTLEKPEAPANTRFEPQRIGKGGTVPTEPRELETTEDGLEEFGSDD
jgi:hypothetical protein